MYSAVDLAKYIINKCVKDEVPISNIQLQMILYCIQICPYQSVFVMQLN